jgi:hypothetical protein
MATIEKRINITPTTRTRLILERYSRITGKPMSRLISELMDESTPVLVDMLDTIEKAQQKPKVAKDAMQKYLDKARGIIDQEQLELDAMFKKKGGRPPKGDRCKTK